MTFEVKQSITFVATYPLMLLTKFRQNPIKHVGGDAFSIKWPFWPLWPVHDLWGQTKHNFCSHSPTGHSDQVWSKSDQACGRRCKLWERRRKKELDNCHLRWLVHIRWHRQFHNLTLFEIWPFSTLDPVTVGLTTGSPWTLLYTSPRPTCLHR